MLQIPIFHVNGEDPEAVAQVVRLALDFRNTFKRDVVIDMYGYRRRGHNEGDEPSFTQPLMYKAIAKRKSVREAYLEHLLKLGRGHARRRPSASPTNAASISNEELDAGRSPQRRYSSVDDQIPGIWKPLPRRPEGNVEDVDTGVDRERLRAAARSLRRTPPSFTPHPKLERLLKRARDGRGRAPARLGRGRGAGLRPRWPLEGYRVRMTGQDCERGTFSQRHAVLHDVRDGRASTCRCSTSRRRPGAVEIYNSPLSEGRRAGLRVRLQR